MGGGERAVPHVPPDVRGSDGDWAPRPGRAGWEPPAPLGGAVLAGVGVLRGERWGRPPDGWSRIPGAERAPAAAAAAAAHPDCHLRDTRRPRGAGEGAAPPRQPGSGTGGASPARPRRARSRPRAPAKAHPRTPSPVPRRPAAANHRPARHSEAVMHPSRPALSGFGIRRGCGQGGRRGAMLAGAVTRAGFNPVGAMGLERPN